MTELMYRQIRRWVCYICLTATGMLGWTVLVLEKNYENYLVYGGLGALIALSCMVVFSWHRKDLSGYGLPVLDGWIWALNTPLVTGILISAFYHSFQFYPVGEKWSYVQFAGYILKRGFRSLTQPQEYSFYCLLLVCLFVSQIFLWIAECIWSFQLIRKEKKKVDSVAGFLLDPNVLIVTSWLVLTILAFQVLYASDLWYKVGFFLITAVLSALPLVYCIQEDIYFPLAFSGVSSVGFLAAFLECMGEEKEFGQKVISCFKTVFVEREFSGIFEKPAYTICFVAGILFLASVFWIITLLILALLMFGESVYDAVVDRGYEVEDEKVNNQETVSKLNVLIEEQNKKIKELQTKVSSLKNLNNRKDKTIQELQTKLSQIDILEKEVRGQLNQSVQLVKDNQELLQKKEKKIQELQERLEGQNAAYKKLEEDSFIEVKGLKERAENYQKQILELTQSVTNNADQKVKVLEKENQRLQEEKRYLQEEIELINLKSKELEKEEKKQEFLKESEESKAAGNPFPFSISCELEGQEVFWSRIGAHGRRQESQIYLEKLWEKKSGEKPCFSVLLESTETQAQIRISGSIKGIKRNDVLLQPNTSDSWIVKKGIYYILTDGVNTSEKVLRLELQ